MKDEAQTPRDALIESWDEFVWAVQRPGRQAPSGARVSTGELVAARAGTGGAASRIALDVFALASIVGPDARGFLPIVRRLPGLELLADAAGNGSATMPIAIDAAGTSGGEILTAELDVVWRRSEGIWRITGAHVRSTNFPFAAGHDADAFAAQLAEAARDTDERRRPVTAEVEVVDTAELDRGALGSLLGTLAAGVLTDPEPRGE